MKHDIDPKNIINFLENSEIQNYLESTERLFLKTVKEKCKETESEIKITNKENQELTRLFKKYRRFVKG